MKAVKIIFAVVLIVFAALQYNDPDPLLWIIIYGVPAVIIIIDLFGRNVTRLYFIAIIALAIYSLFYLPGVVEYFSSGEPGELTERMQASKPYIEETREFIGILIVIAFLFILWKKSK